MITKTKDTAFRLEDESQLLSVHDMAERQGASLSVEQVRLISSSLILISDQLGLEVGTKKHRTSYPNINYQTQVEERGQMIAEGAILPHEIPHLPKLKKNITQSYDVKAFDPSLEYHFKQMCIIFNINVT